LLESELFSFAAFLSTCLLPLDFPTMVNVFRKIIYKYIQKQVSSQQRCCIRR
jgi:tryptophan synthase beta subunit